MEIINAQSIINELASAAEQIKHAAELAGFDYAPEKMTPYDIKKSWELNAMAAKPQGCPWGFDLGHHAETEIMDVKAYTGARDTFSQLPEIEAQHRRELVRMAFEADAELLQDAPDLCGPEFVTIQTSARGHAKIKNTAGNLLAFAAKVRSHAAAFGGGLVRTSKPRAGIVWPAKSVSLFKQMVEDHDYGAALDLAESKLGALFCINKNGRALLQVAPVPVETMPGMVSIMNETGDFSIIEPVSMRCIPGTCKRTRNAQIEAGQRHYDTATPESKARILSEAESMRVDQAACRAQWMAEHAIDDAQEIQTRIDAQAAQDVAQVVASATAAAAIEQAQDSATLCDLGTVATDTAAQAAQDAAPVLETCYAMADSSATVCEASTGAPGGTGGHGVGFATPAARPVAPVGTGQQIKGKSGHWLARFRVLPDGAPVMDFCSNPGGEYQDWKIRIFETGAERMRALQAMASQADKAAQDAAARLVAPVGVSGSAPTVASTGAKIDPPANLNRNSGGYGGAESHSTGSTQAGDPPANLNQNIDDGDSGAAVVAPVGGLSITLERAEGLSSECGQPVTVGSFAEADAVLHAWSETAPSRGGYDKCDFSIVWADGGTYSGRYDLVHHDKAPASLTQHMIDEGEFHTGKFCPMHMSSTAYAQRMAQVSDETRAAYAEVLTIMAGLGVYFAKVRPVAVDLRALVAAGAVPAALVGLGVSYCGDRCNQGGRGAIVAVGNSDYYGLVVDVVLEDGSEHKQTRAASFSDELGARYRLDGKMHGAPYLAQLAATVATVKAQASAAKAMEQAAHAAALVDFVAQFPQLKRADTTYAGGKLAAVNMRILLKQTFKGCKFSVTSDYNSVRVNWTDGPTTAELLEVVGRFDIGASDTQSDYFYTVRTAFSELFGGCQHLSTHRANSPEQVGAALAVLYTDASTRPSAADYLEGRGRLDWGNYDNDRARREMREQLETMGVAKPEKV